MQVIEAKEGQSLIDIAIQQAGDPTDVFALALANDISITDVPGAGRILKSVPIVNQVVSDLYLRDRIYPATIGLEICPCGIGCWTVGIDFIVS